MKQLLLFVAIATTLFACSPRDRAVKLSNGSVVRAEVTNDIPYDIGAKVCIKKYPKSGWYICTDGEMMDSTVNSPVRITHRIGYVSALLD
jgi:hypothetical protein